MALVVAVLLAVFALPAPWNVVAVALAACWELATALLGIRYSRRGAPQVGREALVGRTAAVIARCDPVGQVKVGGEIWAARCQATADVGATVRVRSVDGLTLVVERVPALK